MQPLETAATHEPAAVERWRGVVLVVLLLLGASGLRAWHLRHTEVAARDSIGFIRIAWQMEHDNFRQAVADGQQHPGYPLAILGTSKFVSAAGLPGRRRHRHAAQRATGQFAGGHSARRAHVFPRPRVISPSDGVLGRPAVSVSTGQWTCPGGWSLGRSVPALRGVGAVVRLGRSAHASRSAICAYGAVQCPGVSHTTGGGSRCRHDRSGLDRCAMRAHTASLLATLPDVWAGPFPDGDHCRVAALPDDRQTVVKKYRQHCLEEQRSGSDSDGSALRRRGKQGSVCRNVRGLGRKRGRARTSPNALGCEAGRRGVNQGNELFSVASDAAGVVVVPRSLSDGAGNVGDAAPRRHHWPASLARLCAAGLRL